MGVSVKATGVLLIWLRKGLELPIPSLGARPSSNAHRVPVEKLGPGGAAGSSRAGLPMMSPGPPLWAPAWVLLCVCVCGLPV